MAALFQKPGSQLLINYIVLGQEDAQRTRGVTRIEQRVPSDKRGRFRTRQRAAAPRWPAKVIIMMVAADNPGSARIFSIIANPSISGMCISVRIRA